MTSLNFNPSYHGSNNQNSDSPTPHNIVPIWPKKCLLIRFLDQVSMASTLKTMYNQSKVCLVGPSPLDTSEHHLPSQYVFFNRFVSRRAVFQQEVYFLSETVFFRRFDIASYSQIPVMNIIIRHTITQ